MKTATKSQYVCDSCGCSSNKPGDCCGKAMKKV